jgi:choline dehydrogenase
MGEPTSVLDVDTIIVGAGSAGCLLANRLSADPSHRVLLLEAGGEDDWFWIKVPVGYLFTINNQRTDWCFKTEADPGLNQRSIHYARGKGIGGSSSINAMIYMRGQASDYARWSEMTGDPIWRWDQTLETYKSLEDYYAGANAWHGDAGEMRVERPRVQWDILDAWREAAQEQGIPKIEEFNRGDNEGCAYFQMTQRRGERWSMADAYLHPIRNRTNLTILTKAQVLQLKLRPTTAASLNQHRYTQSAWHGAQTEVYGLDFLYNGERKTALAQDQVILSAGSIGSPQLLQISGIGARAHLESIGVKIQVELPGVGENLQDHLQIRTIYQVENCKTVNTLYKNWITRIGMGLEYIFKRTGPLTMPPSTLGAFTKSDPSKASANIEWHVQPLSLPKFGEPLHPFNAITPSVCNLRPSSRGSVRAVSADPLQDPKIQCNYLSTADDMAVAVASLRLTRKIMAGPALKPFNPKEVLPGPDIQSDADLEEAARNLGTTIFHPVSTCAMGKVDQYGKAENPLTVLDSECRVRGVARLRVIDASAMPCITSGNTNAPVMLIAETVARKIVSERD